MKQLMQTVGQLNANLINPAESQALRLAIREDVKEMEERDKRKSSIVVIRDVSIKPILIPILGL